MRQYSRDVQIHLLITFPSRIVLHEPTSPPLDLHTAARLLLNMLDVAATSANNLRTKVEAWDRLEIDRNALFRPLATTHVPSVKVAEALGGALRWPNIVYQLDHVEGTR